MGLYAVAVKALHREQDANVLTVGYSCVAFAWMAYLAASAGEDCCEAVGLLHLFLHDVFDLQCISPRASHPPSVD